MHNEKIIKSHKNTKRIKLDKIDLNEITINSNKEKENIFNSNKENVFSYGTLHNSKIFGFKFSMQMKEALPDIQLEFPFFYVLKDNQFFYASEIFNAYVKKETENSFILSNDREIKKENVQTEILKSLKKNALFNKKRYKEIIESKNLLKNVVYTFRTHNGEIILHDYSTLGIGYRLKGKVNNNFIKTAEGKFRCIFLQNHENKEIIDAECFLVNKFKDELVFKEIPEKSEFIQTFKIQKKISEHKYLCISKKLKGILTNDEIVYKTGDIVNCYCMINESGLFLKINRNKEKVENSEDNQMAIDFGKTEVVEKQVDKSYAALMHEKTSFMQKNEKLNFIIKELEKELNDKKVLDLLLIYLNSSSEKKASLTKLLNLLLKKDKGFLVKEFLKKIHKENLFEESLINIFMQNNVKLPVLMFHYANKNKKLLKELIRKDYALINFLYKNNETDIDFTRNLIESLLKESEDFLVFKNYILGEIKAGYFNYAHNIFKRAFEIKFKKSDGKKLCEIFLKFKTENCEEEEIEEAEKICEEYYNKFY